MPAFFAFSLGLSAAGTNPLLGAAALAAWINLLGPLTGRSRVMRAPGPD
jgi:hypothetical protein